MSEVQIDWKGYTSPPSELIDATYLSANIKNAQDAVRKALHHVSYFRDEIASLQTQVSLPVAYQAAYHRLFTTSVPFPMDWQTQREMLGMAKSQG